MKVILCLIGISLLTAVWLVIGIALGVIIRLIT